MSLTVTGRLPTIASISWLEVAGPAWTLSFPEIDDHFGGAAQLFPDPFEGPAAERLRPFFRRGADDRVELHPVRPDPGDRPLEGGNVLRGIVQPLDEHDLEPDLAPEFAPEFLQAGDDVFDPDRRLRTD